jgi:hypothetical protein
MDLLGLLAINWNFITIAGLVIGLFVLIYLIIRFATGFINPFNTIDKIVLVVSLVTLLMVWGYSFIENVLYTLIGKVIFFGSIIILLTYFILFYGKSRKSSGTKKKSSAYTRVVIRK